MDISRPWVGRYYKIARLFAVGENMNEDDGYEEIQCLALVAREGILRGEKKNFISRGYGGAVLYVRLTAYATAVLEHSRCMQPVWEEDGFPCKEDMANAFDYLAYTNQVKCSPAGDNSKPTDQMWKNCGRHALVHEIEILQPRTVLILGSDSNASSFKENVLDTRYCNWAVSSPFERGEATIGGLKFEVYVVPHPNRWGFSPADVFRRFRNYLQSSPASNSIA
jgi:hypothetical protein